MRAIYHNPAAWGRIQPGLFPAGAAVHKSVPAPGFGHSNLWVEQPPNTLVSSAFFTLIRDAVQEVRDALRLEVREALERANLRVLVTDLASQVIQTPEDYFDPESLAEWRAEVEKTLKKQASPTDLQNKLSQELDRDFEAIRSRWDTEGTPQYLRGKRVVLAQEMKRAPDGRLISARIAGKPYGPIMRHEIGHFFDFVIGPKVQGHRFSENSEFCRQVLEDINKARTLPGFPSESTRNYVEFLYAFPIKDQGNPRRFQEAFTEIFSALQGGGYLLTPAMARQFFPRSCRYLEETLFPRLIVSGTA